MIVYDVIHGYQPFTNRLISDWVEKNLDKVFIPTSKAMAGGLVRRSVQLQGWTIDAWLDAPAGIRGKAEVVLNNLREAVKQNNIEVGFSAYSHALLPLLGDELAYAEMRVDYDTVCERIAKPAFFWFPECALNAHTLRTLYKRFPGTIAVVPDRAVGLNSSAFVEVADGGVEGRAAACNVLVKDVLMNSAVYEKPPYVPAGLDWKRSLKSMRSGREFKHVLETLDGDAEHVVARDWENGESRDALEERDGAADVAAMLEGAGVEYRLLSEQGEYGVKVSVNEVTPSCWEPLSTGDNPYPYWTPADAAGWRRKVVDRWLEILGIYEAAFNSVVESEAGHLSLDAVDEALKNAKFRRLFKETSPTLLSCLPWHMLARDEWEKFPEFPGRLLEEIVEPEAGKMLDYAGRKSEVKALEAAVDGFAEAIGVRDRPKQNSNL